MTKTLSSVEAAKKYRALGFRTIPVRSGTKQPTQQHWPTTIIDEQDVVSTFTSSNVGVVLGKASGGLVDIDIDCSDALDLAVKLLPHTNMVFGRKGRPGGHWIYKTDPNRGLLCFNAPSGHLLEIRADGHQTVFPGSVHETGEKIEFDRSGDPEYVGWDHLCRAASKLAIATVLKQAWTQGQRHELSLGAAGLLKNAGWPEHEAEELITAVAECCNDPELHDRLKAVQSTYHTTCPVTGRSALATLLGLNLTKALLKWAGGSQESSARISNDLISELGSAEAFASCHSETLRYCDNKWYRRQTNVFLPICDTAVMGLASDFMKNICRSSQYTHLKTKLESKARIRAVVDLSKSDLLIDTKELDQGKMLLGCQNGGVLDLNSRTPVNDPNDIITKRLGVSFDPDATCGRWRAFLTRIFDGDSDLISFIQRSVGYSLTGHVSEQCFFILTGTGANGKSTFLSVLQSLFGEYGGTTPMQTLMQSKNEQSNDLAALVGKRFIFASEGEFGQRLAESKIKLMTGGDRITCRRLYHDFFDYEPHFKLWMATNELPKISGTGEAIWRRIRVIEFPVTIPESERDGNLASRLKEELPGILNWALEGLSEWQRMSGLNPSARVKLATDHYRKDSDTLGQFMDECCRHNASSKTLTGQLHREYENWCSRNVVAEPLSKGLFGRALKNKGYEPYKSSRGNGFRGIELLEAAQPIHSPGLSRPGTRFTGETHKAVELLAARSQ